jgi:hypothetical protein
MSEQENTNNADGQPKADSVRLSALLGSLPTKRLAEIWCELNRWNFPFELKVLEPKDWNDMPPMGRDHNTLSEAMRFIEAKITHKECLREWNKDRIELGNYDEWYERMFGKSA